MVTLSSVFNTRSGLAADVDMLVGKLLEETHRL